MTTTYNPIAIFDTVTTFLTGSLFPAVALLAVLGISVRIAFRAVGKWAGKASK